MRVYRPPDDHARRYIGMESGMTGTDRTLPSFAAMAVMFIATALAMIGN